MTLRIRQLVLVLAVALATSACSTASKLLGDDDPPPPQPQAYQDLTMPPDLQLRAPGTIQAPDMAKPVETVAINEDATPIGEQAATGASIPETTSQSPTAQTSASSTATTDVYAKYGISKYKPDGTLKSPAELGQELRKAQIAEKQQKNPNYGTVFNIGNLFKDE